jgi:hypothetical protein
MIEEPVSPFRDNAEFIAALRGLIDAWCDRRSLGELATILPGYLALNGMTDGWAALYDALKNVRASSRETLPASEMELINQLIRASEKVVYR